MSSKSKGNAYEREAKEELEKEGWTVFRCHRKPLFIRGKMVTVGADIFGCDLVAKKKGLPSKWVQVSTIGQKSAKQKQVLFYPWTEQHEQLELWLRIKGVKGFRKFVYASGQFEEIKDRYTENNEV